MSETSKAIFFSAVLVLLLGELSQAEQLPPATRMDIFTSSDLPIKRLNGFVLRHPKIKYIQPLDWRIAIDVGVSTRRHDKSLPSTADTDLDVLAGRCARRDDHDA